MAPEIEDLQAKHAAERQCGQAIRRLKRGYIGGLECLIADYQGKALRTAFLITHDESTAEGVVQDSFLQYCLHVLQDWKSSLMFRTASPNVHEIHPLFCFH